VLGTVIFNYAFVTSIPSWLNEKVSDLDILDRSSLESNNHSQKHDVSINKSVWSSSIAASALFLLIGFCGISFFLII